MLGTASVDGGEIYASYAGKLCKTKKRKRQNAQKEDRDERFPVWVVKRRYLCIKYMCNNQGSESAGSEYKTIGAIA